MIRRGWPLLLCGYLLVWIPLNFAVELLSAVPSIEMRGTPAIVELAMHGAVAMLSATAGRMALTDPAATRHLASAAVLAAGGVSIQSLFWTALPRNVAPGTRLPLALFAVVTTAFWLVVVHRAQRRPRS